MPETNAFRLTALCVTVFTAGLILVNPWLLVAGTAFGYGAIPFWWRATRN